jgi:hypothetical protein
MLERTPFSAGDLNGARPAKPDAPTEDFHGVAITVENRPGRDMEPLITCGTDWGFACGKDALELYSRPRFGDLRRLVQEMEALPTGPAVAFVEPPASTRPLVLIQSDRGTFYRRHHRGWVSSWIDFRYAAAHLAFTGVERQWHAAVVHVDHPTLSPWPRNTSKAMLEALGHARAAGMLPSLREVVFHPCGRSLTASQVQDEVSELQGEDTSFRPLKVKRLSLDSVDPGLAHVVALNLERVSPVPSA